MASRCKKRVKENGRRSLRTPYRGKRPCDRRAESDHFRNRSVQARRGAKADTAPVAMRLVYMFFSVDGEQMTIRN